MLKSPKIAGFFIVVVTFLAAGTAWAAQRRWTVDGKTVDGTYISFQDGRVKIRTAKGDTAGFAFRKLSDDDKRKVLRLEDTLKPRSSPKWVPGYRVRYTMRVMGDLLNQRTKTVIARIPTGGWLKSDLNDLVVMTASGREIPLVVLSHAPEGDTIIQFRRNGYDRWYWIYAANPDAPGKDLELQKRLTDGKRAAEQAVLDKMAAMKESARQAGLLRDISAKVQRERSTLDKAKAELAEWDKLMPERLKAAKDAADKVAPARQEARKAAAAHAPFQKVADEKTQIARRLSRQAAKARKVVSKYTATIKAADNARKALEKATANLRTARDAASKAADQAQKAREASAKAAGEAKAAREAADKAVAEAKAAREAAERATGEAKAEAQRKAAAKAKAAEQAKRTAAQKAKAAKKAVTEEATAKKIAEAKKASAKAAEAKKTEAEKLLREKESAAKAVAPKKAAAEKVAAEKTAAAKAAGKEAQAARLAAAPTGTVKAQADKKLAELVAASKRAQKAVDDARKRIAEAKALRNRTEQNLAKLMPKLKPIKEAAEAARAAAKKAVTEAEAKQRAYFQLAYEVDPRLFKEGLTVEFREWAGDELSNWPAVVKGLQRSENVLGNAVVGQVLQNVNPFRRSDPRNFAASYRGYLKIDKPGVYSFFVNGDDTVFLFINGYKVYSRTGSNRPIWGKVPIYSVGADIQLERGVHPFEVHHIVGNTATASGLCLMLWLTPGSKNWQIVPRSAFTQASLAVPVAVEAFDGSQVAVFDFAMDDTLSADGVTLYLSRLEAQGPVTDPKKLVWNFGDGTKGTGRSVSHIFFGEGDYVISLRSHAKLPPFRRRCHVWAPAVPTSPHSLVKAVSILAATDITKLDTAKLNDVFHFLRICEQPARWPVTERLCRHLLSSEGLDVKYRVLLYTSLMEALARQGRGTEALKLVDQAMSEVGGIRSLRAMILLEAANVNRDFIRDFRAAGRLYARIIEENRRLRHHLIRRTAVAWGDMFLEAGDLARAGEVYRLARQLGGLRTSGGGKDDAVERGALLRVAEQQLRGGNIRQTRRMIRRIEAEFPEQKLGGLYRFLRGEAERHAGRYERAIRNYEVLLQLRQWAGYRPSALFGIADSYCRGGEFDKGLKWLATLKTSFPDFFSERKLDQYQANVEKRISRLDGRETEAGTASAPAPMFSAFKTGFEPDEAIWKDRVGPLGTRPAMGLDGPHTIAVGSGRSTVHLPELRLRNIPPQGSLWVELWYRDRCGIAGQHPNHRSIQIEVRSEADHQIDKAVIYPLRTFGQWQKAAFRLRSPPTPDGVVKVSVSCGGGWLEIDGLKILHTSDRQSDVLRTFIAGVDPQ